ncbi:MAG TPA: OsmC family peroxiredoxin [Longimicrobiaceae bacterium]|nr:OsmC family peroxiredoxin [Longimicrobiaceae bacterium]
MSPRPTTGAPGALQTGSRVFVRAPRLEDCEEWLALNRMSAALYRGRTARMTRLDQFAVYVERCTRDDYAGFFVCRREDGAIVGSANLSQIFRGNFRSCYLGYQVGAPFAGRGYMTEGVDLVLRHAFGPLRLHRVEANVQPGNGASIALVRRLGFTREGLSRRYLKIGGRWRDHERWAILQEDWRALHRGRGGPAGPPAGLREPRSTQGGEDMPTSNASATWEGGLKEGSGSFEGESGKVGGSYTVATRFAGERGGTNPEELLAAAEASCYSMALSAGLEKNGTPPERVRTEAACTVEKQGEGFTITGIRLKVRARVPGVDAETFQKLARDTKDAQNGCPVSRALAGVRIEVDAELE